MLQFKRKSVLQVAKKCKCLRMFSKGLYSLQHKNCYCNTACNKIKLFFFASAKICFDRVNYDSTWSSVCNKFLATKRNMIKFQESLCLFEKQPPDVFCKKGVLKNFADFTGKHLCQRLFFNKVGGLRLQPYSVLHWNHGPAQHVSNKRAAKALVWNLFAIKRCIVL